MSGRAPRFEIVRSVSGWHARFRAANGRTVWTTDCYPDRRTALEAIHQLSTPVVENLTTWSTAVLMQPHGLVEVRTVDERDLVDDVVVHRILNGDPTPARTATPAERRAVVAAWTRTTGKSLADLARLTGWKPERYTTPTRQENTAA